ncbi:MAG: hypothetical protein V3Q69_13725 (plasmid) [Burkholderia sp.]
MRVNVNGSRSIYATTPPLCNNASRCSKSMSKWRSRAGDGLSVA